MRTRVSRILGPDEKPMVMPVRRKDLSASYDVIQRWDENDHWTFATSQSASRLDTPEVLQRLRNAARYEFRNNSYARSVVLKQANEVLGTGPKLQIEPLSISDRSMKAADRLEKFWNDEYCPEIKFNDRLRVGLIERPVGGEVFSVFRRNDGITTVPVDFENYEGDQFQTPYYLWDEIYRNREYPPVDGIVFDTKGNVEEYYRLRYHPNGLYPWSIHIGEVDRIRPEFVCHLFRKERPSQYRGVTELAPCLELFAKLRRYTDATIETAERQARIVGRIKTNASPEVCADVWDEPVEFDIFGGQFMNMPDGWDAEAFSATQPVSGYAEFKREILHEIFAAFLMPWNVASGDSSDYNFASGRLDYIIFYHIVDIIRDQLETDLLNRFFKFWFEYAMLIPGVVPTGLGAFRFQWFWDEREPIDVNKQAQADKTYDEIGRLNVPRFYRRQGMSWRDGIDQQLLVEQYEKKRRIELGLASEASDAVEETEEQDEPVTA